MASEIKIYDGLEYQYKKIDTINTFTCFPSGYIGEGGKKIKHGGIVVPREVVSEIFKYLDVFKFLQNGVYKTCQGFLASTVYWMKNTAVVDKIVEGYFFFYLLDHYFEKDRSDNERMQKIFNMNFLWSETHRDAQSKKYVMKRYYFPCNLLDSNNDSFSITNRVKSITFVKMDFYASDVRFKSLKKLVCDSSSEFSYKLGRLELPKYEGVGSVRDFDGVVEKKYEMFKKIFSYKWNALRHLKLMGNSVFEIFTK